MSVAEQVLRSATRGVIDALSLQRCLILLVKSEKIRVRLVQCLVLNGLIFLGSIFLFNHVLRHALGWALAYILEGDSVSAIQQWIDWIYFFFWIAPVYMLCFVLNTLWYQDIASESLRIYPNAAPAVQTSASVTGTIVELVFRSLFNFFFLIYLALLSRIRWAYLVNMAWLISYNAFEYKWIHARTTFGEKIFAFEKNWIYFLCFGAPLALLATRFPSVVENGFVSLIFPFLLMTASTASRPQGIQIPRQWTWWPLWWLERARVFIVPESVTKISIIAVEAWTRSRSRRP